MITVVTRRQIAQMLATYTAVCVILVVLHAPVWTIYVGALLIGWPWIIPAKLRQWAADDANEPAERPRVGARH